MDDFPDILAGSIDDAMEDMDDVLQDNFNDVLTDFSDENPDNDEPPPELFTDAPMQLLVGAIMV